MYICSYGSKRVGLLGKSHSVVIVTIFMSALARHMLKIYLNAGMNMVTLTTDQNTDSFVSIRTNVHPVVPHIIINTYTKNKENQLSRKSLQWEPCSPV